MCMVQTVIREALGAQAELVRQMLVGVRTLACRDLSVWSGAVLSRSGAVLDISVPGCSVLSAVPIDLFQSVPSAEPLGPRSERKLCSFGLRRHLDMDRGLQT